ncbi:MAG TPA: presqualene diphosphate synthase HpnD [Nitrospiria bacterium]|jgi:phytoene synthase|nr:presqualene diphosphate synthase HpnD [Nitrospiria bacterium]
MSVQAAQSRHRESNFAPSFLFLPGPQREAIERVYAFCRALDDVSDSALNPEEKKRRLEFWRAELSRCYDGRGTHPIILPLQKTVKEFRLTRTHFEELIQGVEMDLTTSRYANFVHLSQYCYRVAGTVGLICIEIFGCPDERDYAVALGIAFQITNILRDVKDDAQRGRIYLPQDDLRRFGYTEAELMKSAYNEPFVELMRFEAERAGDYFRRAADLLKPEHRRQLIAPEIMAAIYSALLRRIQTVRYNVFEHRVRLSKPRKLALAVKTALMIRTGIGHPIPT